MFLREFRSSEDVFINISEACYKHVKRCGGDGKN